MLTDTGPLIALLDQRQSAHTACVEVYESAELPLVTTWPCFPEAMHILGRIGGWKSQALLWGLVQDAGVSVHAPSTTETDRMHSLMEKYNDLPMDLADASLVATAETRQLRRIFTLDSDFRVYRAHDKELFEVVP
jgi:predicted nucleic acid-binding protein